MKLATVFEAYAHKHGPSQDIFEMRLNLLMYEYFDLKNSGADAARLKDAGDAIDIHAADFSLRCYSRDKKMQFARFAAGDGRLRSKLAMAAALVADGNETAAVNDLRQVYLGHFSYFLRDDPKFHLPDFLRATALLYDAHDKSVDAGREALKILINAMHVYPGAVCLALPGADRLTSLWREHYFPLVVEDEDYKKWDENISIYLAELKEKDDSRQNWGVLKAYYDHSSGRPDLAYSDIEDAVAKEPENGFWLTAKANLLIRDKRYAEAETILCTERSYQAPMKTPLIPYAASGASTRRRFSTRAICMEVCNWRDRPPSPTAH